MANTATQRIIALIDMDCFYCQVEARLNPSLKGKPIAVVQYNQWKGGGIIAVNYEARDAGVTRHMRGSEAQKHCPEICLVSVPSVRGKADLTKYRDAGEEVAAVFSEFSDCVQRASIDEAFIDLTKAVNDKISSGLRRIKEECLNSTFVVGYSNLKGNENDDRKKGLLEWLRFVDSQTSVESADFRLAIGALIVEEMRAAVFSRTGFHCSAGIAHNKILSKLVAGLHKPKCQTILPHDSVPELYETLPIHKVRNLGGKLGKFVAQKLSVNFMSELYQFSLKELQQKFDEKTGAWLYNIARGIDNDPVTPRLRPESIGCCKNFPGKNALNSVSAVEHWIKELSTEIGERLSKDLEKNKRRAKLMTVSFHQECAMSRSGPLNSYEASVIASDAMNLLRKFNTASSITGSWIPPIKLLGVSVSKFSDEQSSIGKYLTTKTNNISIQPKTSCDIAATTVAAVDVDTTTTTTTTTAAAAAAANNPASHSRENETPPTNENSIKNYFPKAVEEDASKEPVNKVATSCSEGSKSFFLSFINKTINERKSNPQTNGTPQEEDDSDSDLSQNLYVSLSEVFPDLKKADAEIVDLLPQGMKDKYQKRISSEVGEVQVASTSASTSGMQVEKNVNMESEICSECKKKIPLVEFWEHIDYHAAIKLDNEINKKTVTPVKVNAGPSKDKTDNSKRKKGRPAKTNNTQESKKMKSITSFFNVIPK